MASTFTKILVHFIFSTKNREPLISPELEKPLFSYMVGIATNHGCYTVALNGTADHVHMLISLGKMVPIAKLMEEVKGDSSRWVNKEHRQAMPFRWQDGYAGFSIGESGLAATSQYIANQKSHHQRWSFQEELIRFLNKYGIEYDERYIWR